MRHGHDSGFALLLVFLMAAMIALSLYMEIPRVAFETQRQKEQLVVERGEQYKRAIKLFVSPRGGMGHWPAKIEDLENTNNRRFLRHRYLDPFTGKDDWRLIHVQNGVLTDSAINKLKNPADPNASSGTLSGAVQSSVGTLSGVSGVPDGSGSNSGQLNANPALRRRTSEGGVNPGAIGPDGQPVPGGALAIGPDGQPYPNAQQPYPGTQPYPGSQAYPGSQQPYPGSQPSGMQQTYPGSQPMQQFPTGGQVQPYVPGGAQPGQFPGQLTQYPGMPGPPVNSQTGGVSPTPYPTQPGAQGQSPYFGQPGMQGANPGQQAAAAAIINQILMTPNPRGLAGVQGAMGGALMGSGIAGVGLASTMDDESIMIYNERSKYKEWEFVYDPTKDRPLPNPNGSGVMAGPGAQMGNTFAPGPGPGSAGATMQPPVSTTGTGATPAPKQ